MENDVVDFVRSGVRARGVGREVRRDYAQTSGQSRSRIQAFVAVGETGLDQVMTGVSILHMVWRRVYRAGG